MKYEMASCVRGYHVYKEIWEAVIGERLVCERQPENQRDRYAVAIKKNDGTILGHVPRKISKLPVCSLFLQRGGSIECIVSGRRRYSADLQQGGLEIPSKLIFKASSNEVQKLKCLL